MPKILGGVGAHEILHLGSTLFSACMDNAKDGELDYWSHP